jgi:acetyl-CoA carboxylase carboxyltransferase component
MLAFSGDDASCAGYIKSLISFLPDNAATGIQLSDSSDNLNRMLGDLDFCDSALTAISVIVDNGVFINLGADYAKGVSTVLATVGGVKCGIVANSFIENSGKIDASVAKKIARFVNFCDSFSIPVVTLVDSLGIAIDKENEDTFAPELARLAGAYASSEIPKVTVILGHAIGAAFVLLGSKSLGADLVYSLGTAEIGALSAESGVAFAWDKYISEEKTRAELISESKATVSSPVKAAASGEIDDIIGTNELRARICSALLMLSAKGKYSQNSRKVLPL